MEEIKARGGPVIAIVDKADSQAVEIADEVIRIPAVPEFLQEDCTPQALAADLPVRVAHLSEAERGFTLASGGTFEPVRASRVPMAGTR